MRIVDVLEGVVEVDDRYVGAKVESRDLTTDDHRGLPVTGVGPGRGTGATGGVYEPCRYTDGGPGKGDAVRLIIEPLA